MLDKFSEAIRGNLSKLDRGKLVALVTIEVIQVPCLNNDSSCNVICSNVRFYHDVHVMLIIYMYMYVPCVNY